jgi:hypothetical protein
LKCCNARCITWKARNVPWLNCVRHSDAKASGQCRFTFAHSPDGAHIRPRPAKSMR